MKRGTINGFVSICREILLRFIEQNFPTTISVEVHLYVYSTAVLTVVTVLLHVM